MSKIINLYGGPGTGKSTTAAGLFHLMKLKGYEVELVTEFAKDLTWSERHYELANQVFVLGEQYHRIYRLLGKVDYIITDSPVLLSAYYSRYGKNERINTNIKELAYALYDSLENIDIFLKRVKPYNPNGRNQSESEAIEIDIELQAILPQYSIIPADQYAPEKILEEIEGKH